MGSPWLGGSTGSTSRDSSSPSSIRSSSGSRTLQEPKEVNQRRVRPARRRRSRPARRGRRRGRSSSSSAATSSMPAQSRVARVASRTLRKPWCSKPVSASRWRRALCRPAVHLKATSRSSAASMQAASSWAAGNASASAPPVRNFSRWSAAAISSRAPSQPGVGRAAVEPGRLDVDGHVVVELAGGDQLVDGGDDAPGVVLDGAAGVVAQRDLERAEVQGVRAGGPADRALERAGAPGHDHADRERVRRRRRGRAVASRRARSGSCRSLTTNGPTRSAYAAAAYSRCSVTALGSGTLPGGKIAASSTSRASQAGERAGHCLTRCRP